MDDEGTQDVNNAEETTASDSSTADETTQDVETTESTESQDNEDTLADGTKRSEKTVPYEVFAETNAKVKALEEKIANFETRSTTQNADPEVEAEKAKAKEALKGLLSEMGYVSKEDLQRTKADEALENTLKSLEKQWDGKADPALKFNRKEVIDYALENGIASPEAAFKLMKEKELTNFRIKEAISKSKGITTEGSNGTGSGSVGPTNDDLKTAAMKGDKSAGLALMKRAIANAK